MSINIKSDREYLREIADKIANGKYAVPLFQRNFVWDKRQVLDLFDSIIKGYPIGTVLLWKTPPDDLYQYKHVLTDERLEGANPDYCILDGRQRLTAFYGCVLRSEGKREEFNLYYDLEQDELCYLHAQPKTWQWPICDIFDTFSLLKKGQPLMGEPDALEYIDKARKLNSLLLSYVVGEIIMVDGGLEEARMAFTRLNSKGTPISNWFMHQALSYSNSDDRVLSESLEEIRQSIAPYGFERIKEDDILDCCYKYAGRRYSDNIKELEKVDVKLHLPEVKADLGKAVQFLHDECMVFSSGLMPYSKQIVPLCHYFHLNPTPDDTQRAEVRRWFFYLFYNQLLSGSLSNMRQLFNRFDEFARGERPDAYDGYAPVARPAMDFSFRTGTAKSNFLLVSQIYKRLQGGLSPQGLRHIGNYTLVTHTPAGVLPMVSAADFGQVAQMLASEANDARLASYCLDREAVECYRNKDYDRLVAIRQQLVADCEAEFLQHCGLEVQ